jgi:DNA-binding response OmpR family regulator
VVVLIQDEGEWAALRAVEAGADDCAGRSVSYLELRARVRAVLRRTRRTLTATPRRVGALALDPRRQEVHFAGRRVDLARYEYLLLTHLAVDPERVSPGASCCARTGATAPSGTTRTLDAHACRLRKKLEQAGAVGYVVNRHGVGYRLVERVPAIDDLGQPGAVSPNGQPP